MKPVALSKHTARKIILNAQLLNSSSGLAPGKAGALQIVDQLGYIQIDTIHIIERSHHHTLWTRLPGYADAMLHTLQAVDRTVFEYWAHAMSYLPMSDYRFFLFKMRNFNHPAHPWLPDPSRRSKLPFKLILKRIREEGALTAKDFSRPDDKKGGAWWDWKPAKLALEILFWRGELMISERRNFQKVYDLTERVLPPEIDTRMPSEKEMAEYLIIKALSSMGIANPKEIYEFMQPAAARDSIFRAVEWDVFMQAAEELIEDKKISSAIIEDEKENRYFLLRGMVDRIADFPELEQPVYLLSPFDNLIIQRDRLERLFGFKYTLECYSPAPKRQYGYFILPVLFDEKFVGRVDPEADRKSRTMIFHSVSLENDFKPPDEFYEKFSTIVAEFARFNQCDTLVVEQTRPAKCKTVLRGAIKKQGGVKWL